MSNNPKCFIRKTCIEITFRTEEGLPLVAAPYIKAIVMSILARSQSLYPVTLSHFIVMANHIHLVLVVDYPESIPDFVGYLKGELSHAVNNLLGRKKHTVWCDGYDSPRILDQAKVIERIVYLYTNPQKAGLVERIEEYPHCSSWQEFLDGGAELEFFRIPRPAVPKLPRASLSFLAQENITQELLSQGEEEATLFIDPDAWMLCFKEFANADPHQVKEEIVKGVRDKEKHLREAREHPVVGAHALRLESMRKEYVPEKRGKRMICLCSFKELRVVFICWFKEQCAKAREWYLLRKAGNTLANPPPGMFAPGGVLASNLNPAFVPV